MNVSARLCAGAGLAGVAVLVAKGDLPVRQSQDAVVAQRDPEDVRRQVFQCRPPAPYRAAINDPVLLPDRGGDAGPQLRLAEGRPQLGPEEDVQGLDVDQEVGPGRHPGAPIWGESAPWDEIVDVGMVAQVACPGL